MNSDGFKRALAAKMAEPAPYPEGRFAGDGIVVCAGGPRLFTCAWILLTHLRHVLKCTLPIEVWHIGPEEMGPAMRALLEELDVAVVDALDVAKRHPVALLGGWELKPYAVQHSRFERILLIDADNLPVRDPAYLFDSQAFQTHGALFWPDIVKLRQDNEIWDLCGLAYRDEPSFETGQMVIDKARSWPALSLTVWLNQQSDFLYDYIYGDKDTFLIAWWLCEQPFSLVPHPVKQLPFVLCQFDPEGTLLFQHRSNAKWVLFGENRKIDGFQHEDRCRAALGELRKKWNGKVFHPPERSPAARSVEARLLRQKRFTMTQAGAETRDIELAPGYRIGSGAGHHEFYWWVEDGEDGPDLVIQGYERRTAVLRPEADGAWYGTQLIDPHLPLVLTPRDRDRSKTWAVQASSDTDGLLSLAGEILDLYRRLPMDQETQRDLTGALTTLIRLDTDLNAQLPGLLDGTMGNDPVAATVHAVVGDGESSASDGQRGVRRGHNAFNARFHFASKYDR